MIGDKISDKECAKKSKIKFQYFSYNLFKNFNFLNLYSSCEYINICNKQNE